MSKIKFLVIFLITMIISTMTLGYAALQERIDIEGEASIDSTYRVEISSVTEGVGVGDASSISPPSYSGLSASFSVRLYDVADSISYEVVITNYGSVDVILNNTSITVDGNHIKAVKSGIKNGDILLHGQSKTVNIKISYSGEQQDDPVTGTINFGFEYTRVKGGVGEVVAEGGDSVYSAGDEVSFAGSDWYVIKDSAEEDDYVTVMRSTRLLTTEIDNSYVNFSNTGTNLGTVSFYWSPTCHYASTYGGVSYEDNDYSGCSNHNDYSTSKIREFLEGSYVNSLDVTKLKEVDGYKIRLITTDELINNLGWTSGVGTSAKTTGNNVPSWVYNTNYWTMSPKTGSTTNVWQVLSGGNMNNLNVSNTSVGVRPVINLLKTAIE